MTAGIFDHYAGYYDLLYRDKDYKSEAEFISRKIGIKGALDSSVLDLGCGTGRHDIFLAEIGHEVTGVEMSEKMLKTANENLAAAHSVSERVRFIQGDVRNVRVGKKFDSVISLFHVLSYQTRDEDVLSMFATAREHLRSGGRFLFDFWYGPAVLHEKPEVRTKKLEDQRIEVIRTAVPELDESRKIVNVNYTIQVKDKKSCEKKEFREQHCMRYFFMPEISRFLEEAGMNLILSEEWMTSRELSENSWSAFAIAGAGN